MALFGEKYGDEVRVLKIGDFSTELCGGTHVRRAGDIGFFKIVSESGIAAGVRRIEAITGQAALDFVASTDQLVRDLSALVRGNRGDLEAKVRGLLDENRKLDKEIQSLRNQLVSNVRNDDKRAHFEVNGTIVYYQKYKDLGTPQLRDAVEKERGKDKVFIAANTHQGSVTFAVSSGSPNIKANDVVAYLSAVVGGKGGGRPDFAQGGGTEISKLDEALQSVETWMLGSAPKR
jgi:alanyl-tRNA synthetase